MHGGKKASGRLDGTYLFSGSSRAELRSRSTHSCVPTVSASRQRAVSIGKNSFKNRLMSGRKERGP
ncbi:MAG: hypothetical protein ACYS83_01195 [Planctomycetota bacterium]|jgi:hypothetical protein